MNQEKRLLCHCITRTQQNSDFGKLRSKELNDMALQPNCALWKLRIAAGDAPGAFLLRSVYELYVHRYDGALRHDGDCGKR